MQQAAAILLDQEGILAAEVDGACRWCVHDEQARRSPCLCFNHPTVQSDSMFVRFRDQQPYSSIWTDGELTNVCDLDLGFGRGIRLKYITRAHARGTGQSRDFPG